VTASTAIAEVLVKEPTTAVEVELRRSILAAMTLFPDAKDKALLLSNILQQGEGAGCGWWFSVRHD
jgi:hypothetical protein